MIRRRLITTIAAAALLAMIQAAQGSFTLNDLVNHLGGSDGTLTIGDKIFSNFGYVSSGLATDPGNLVVTAIETSPYVYGLDWGGAIAVYNLGPTAATGDLKLTYTVTVNPLVSPGTPISMIDQNYTPNALARVLGNQIIIGETVMANVNNQNETVANSTLSLTPSDLSDPPVEAGDNLYLNPAQMQLNVVKDIPIGAAAYQLVGLSDVEQSFHEIPEPTTMIAGLLLLVPFGASTLQSLRKSRVA